ncbi:down-regulated in metastasis [Colletotrichum graminicola]|uniref:Down-regulated in metastasis n=1 Tax=Colletotrichum graminicola (strain M1.001 / M2 / FGSC 10212) TaxID=645133 RepID=E3QKC9_COLGM|nr:down-regulated in metastasis [Colletotrichum graminicola M1.001]EFQ31317.1 down-regulated in metastasis [Colletotrichum graminicola M1.001]WDK19337.1 down-regulated in metastasis [Colletotrichum graminicola]
MPSTSSGRITKSHKGKYSTPHQKNHRWESFAAKISKLNALDPLRKVRRHDLDAEDLEATTSYFRNGLQRWGELNISKGFNDFKRQALPLSESLAQILHFEEKIFGLLEESLAKQDKEALEPLLELLTAFAHDIGTRFEKYYAKSLHLIVAIAGKPQDVDVIEWTFAALAFLFKYLSRLIVPDLRPTYDVVAPLLGKARHPPHIARFAAEAMSFLIKKAAAPANRETALVTIVSHARDDLRTMVGERQFQLYQDGLMTMFAEAMKGPGQTIHSTGPAVFTALMQAIPETEADLTPTMTWTDLVCGVLTSVTHHSNDKDLAPVLEAMQGQVQGALSGPKPNKTWKFVPQVRVIGTAAGVRHGNRISNWTTLVENLTAMLDSMAQHSPEATEDKLGLVWRHVIVNAAIVWHQAPIEALIPSIKDFMTALQRERLMRWYIPFCAYFSNLDSTRFRSLFQTYFQRFIVSHWSDGRNEDMLCVFLPRMVQNGSLPSPGGKETCNLPRSWQDQIVSKFERLEASPFPERGAYDKDPQTWRDRCLPKYSALLDLLFSTTVHPSASAKIAELLLRKLRLALKPSSTLASDEVHFSISQGFHAYLRMSRAAGPVDPALNPLLRAALPRFSRSVGFLEAYLTYTEATKSQPPLADHQSSDSSEGSEEDPVVQALIENLSAPSHQLRLASLKILQQFESTPDELQCHTLMLDIEHTAMDLSSLRNVAMHLRKLGQNYSQLKENSWLIKAIPSFMFGMLTIKLSPLWDDTITALKLVGESKKGEENITATAFNWLETPSPRWSGPGSQPTLQNRQAMTDFDCRHVQQLWDMAGHVEEVVNNATDLMLKTFDEQQQTVEAHADTARAQALKVLTAMPHFAEKRSRKLVPFFLAWAGDDEDLSDSQEDEDVPTKGEDWSLQDRKALIGVFALFINPKVLYQNERVYHALLHLMENGDVEVQKLALKAILAWKQEGVRPYQENLEYLLDEARFKNEVTVFLQGESAIRPEHREELMPVLLRLLYGRTISKKGVASGRHGLQATRLTVLRNLSVEDTGSFLDIAIGGLKDARVIDESGFRASLFDKEILPVRKQLGFMNMMLPLINELGAHVGPYTEKLIHPVMYCLIFACRRLRESAAESDEEAEEPNDVSQDSMLKVIRTTGLKCLITLFRNAQDFNWPAYSVPIVNEVVTPRVEKLPIETAQSVSGIMQLLSTWSQLPRAALFISINDQILPKVIECLSVVKGKENVKIFALSIVRNLVKLAQAPAGESEFNELIRAELLDANMELTLKTIVTTLETQTMGNELLEACIETIVELSPLVETSANVHETLKIATFLLNQPPRRVNPRAKGKILLILERFITILGSEEAEEQTANIAIFDTLSSLFSYFKDRDNRQALARVLTALAEKDNTLREVAEICSDLNSFAKNRIDEPDYDKRLVAFTRITNKETPFSVRQWLPLLHNLIYYIRSDEEYGILASNSADCLRKFIREAASCSDQAVEAGFESHLKTILLPSIYTGAREESPTVRREYLRVFGYLLAQMPTWEPVADMKGLLTGELAEETSELPFFFNILSPATSRQLEAIRMLDSVNDGSEIGSQNLSQFFIPLLEHFIFGRTEGSDDQGLGAQATITIGNLAQSLDWKHYRVILQRYISYVESKPDNQKQVIRLLAKFCDALIFAVGQAAAEPMQVDDSETTSPSGKRLVLTKPPQDKLSKDVNNLFLPSLIKHLHEKDESEVSYRVPVGVIIVKLLKLLPLEEMGQKLAGVLTDICHILRSKSWEAREMARDTLVQIASVLGPTYFSFILKELRGALKRGYQLHVMSYTLHSMLLKIIPEFQQGDLDYTLRSIVSIIIDDIFGVTGQEKDAEGYISEMKEVKASKSQDSMELIAKSASISQLVVLVHPLQSLLLEKVDLKLVRKIDTLLARITAGLLQNPASESRDTLIFCYEVIQEVYKNQKTEVQPKIDYRLKKYLYQKGVKKDNHGTAGKYTFKLVKFAFDILRSVWKKYDSLRTATNIAGFVPILGDAIVGGEDDVKTAAFRLLTVLVKVPFNNDEDVQLYKVAVKEATKSISMSSSTTTELSQAALKLLSVVLRERKDIPVKDAAIDMLLGKLKDDLTETLYRHVTFNFLRSVLERKIETAVVYDTLDYVGTVMITNDDKDTRDLARGAFFQFLKDYPQRKARWVKQLNFVVANLTYEREGGRLSVMEVVHLLLMKSADDFVQEVISTCFLPLVMVLANDDSEKCCLAAGELIKEMFRRADKERTQNFMTLLRSWLEQEDNPAVTKLSLQAFGLFFEAKEPSSKHRKELELVLGKIGEIVGTGDIRVADEDLINTVLHDVQVLTEKYPARLLSSEAKELWGDVRGCLVHPENSVKLSTTKVLSTFLADFAGKSNKPGEALKGSHGLDLEVEDLEELVRLTLYALRTPEIDDALAAEITQILIFLGPRLPVKVQSVPEAETLGDRDETTAEEDRIDEHRKDLQYLFWKLSSILRRDVRPKSTAITPKTVAMEVLETICRRVPQDNLEPSFKTILYPLQNLTDPNIPVPFSTDDLFKTRLETLKTRAQILMDSLQKKFGTAEYTKQLLAIREEVRTRRQQRSSKRKIEAIAHPEKYGRDKRKKTEKKKERKKVRSHEHKQFRQAYKGW